MAAHHDRDTALHPPWLVLQLLGTPTLRRRGSGEAEALLRHDAALLALLALEGSVARSRVAAWLWPDSDARHAGLSLRQRIHRLKRRAAADVVVGDATLALAAGVVHDLARDGPGGAAAGPALLLAPFEFDDDEGEFSAWLRSARQRLQAQRMQWLAGRAEALLGDGRLAEALDYAERLVTEQPTAEHAHRRVMRLHYLRGDRAAALAAHARCVQWLERDIGAAPGAETEALAAQIERSALPAPAPAQPLPLTLLRPPLLVGREPTWRVLAQALADNLRAIVLAGEPGVGKSRLAADFAASLGARAAHACARAHDAGLAYASLRRLLAALPPPVDPWAHGVLARVLRDADEDVSAPPARLRAAHVQRALAAAAVGWRQADIRLLVFDDVQHADAATLDALLALAAVAEGPTCLLAVRSAEMPFALQAWLQRQSSGTAIELRLGALDAGALQALLQSLELPALAPHGAHWSRALWQHTAGNPLFVLATLGELARAGLPTVVPERLPTPTLLAPLLDRRLQALPDGSRRLAQLAALAGPDFCVALAAEVLDRDALALADAWGALEAAEVVNGQGFAHDLVRDAALRSVPDAIARELHGRIARAAARLGAPALRVALHAEASHEPALALQAWSRAALAARSSEPPAQALRIFDRLAAAADRSGDDDGAFEAQCQALDMALVVEPPERVQARLQALAARADTPLRRADVQLARARWATHLNDARATIAAARAARDELSRERRRNAADRRHLDAALVLGVGLAAAGETADALDALAGCRAQVDAGADPHAERQYWSLYGNVLCRVDRRREAVAAFEQAIALAEAQGEGADAMIDLANLAGTLGQLGRTPAALDVARRAEAWRARLGEADGISPHVSRLTLGTLCVQSALYAEGVEALQSALAGFVSCGVANWIVAAENHLATSWLRLGQPARARALLGAVAEAATIGRSRRALLLARLDREAGRSGAARLAEHAERVTQEPLLNRVSWAIGMAAELPPAQALEQLTPMRVAAEQHQLDACALAARVAEAGVLARLGLRDDALARAGEAIAAFEGGCCPHDMDEGEFWSALHKALAAAGDARAAAALERARGWLQDVAAAQVPAPWRRGFRDRQLRA